MEAAFLPAVQKWWATGGKQICTKLPFFQAKWGWLKRKATSLGHCRVCQLSCSNLQNTLQTEQSGKHQIMQRWRRGAAGTSGDVTEGAFGQEQGAGEDHLHALRPSFTCWRCWPRRGDTEPLPQLLPQMSSPGWAGPPRPCSSSPTAAAWAQAAVSCVVFPILSAGCSATARHWQ